MLPHTHTYKPPILHCRYEDSERAQLEMPRLILYLANGVFVMSERGVVPSLEEVLEGSLVFLPRGQSRVWTLRFGSVLAPFHPLCSYNCHRDILSHQMTPEFVSKFLGANPAAVGLRRATGVQARQLMRTKFRCEDMANFRHSVATLLHAAYPPWYTHLFVNVTLANW
jgi:hypothetical protein